MTLPLVPAPRRPGVGIVPFVLALCAGVAVLIHHAVGAGHGHRVPDAAGWPSAAATGWAWWLVMVIVMMFPLVADDVVRTANAGLRSRRLRSAAAFLLGYLTVWAAVGLPLVGVVGWWWPTGTPTSVAVAVLLGAAVWQLSPFRRRMLIRCGGGPFVAIDGWQAIRDCASHGAVRARRCVLTCGVAMLAMAVTHSLIVMVGLTAMLMSERRPGPNPHQRAGRSPEALGIVGMAGLVAWWSMRGAGTLP
ncbi:hypothetical protein GTV32_16925 [Gordonia sp. SID5947]|uniref:copper chaperone n=1 Tax=Gordonia sp. SID5947 TaxID=2690315 RepID=UPI00136CD3C3|nr:DUF2182 domain-containing protein [Gordonia sp. SID5947]MYR07876.1 hypothetical protein [Gordonia sp. SID5947]